MVNYQNGKIYKIEPICDHEEGDIYIGSTTKKYLSQRMDAHRSAYVRFLDGKANKVNSYILFDKYGVENCKIILLENYPCDSKDELHAREGYYEKNMKCVNKNIAGRNLKQYYIDNREKLLTNQKVYQENNKEKIKQTKDKYREKKRDKLFQKLKCNCGGHYTYTQKARHFKSTKHKEYEFKQKIKEGIFKCPTLAELCKFINN